MHNSSFTRFHLYYFPTYNLFHFTATKYHHLNFISQLRITLLFTEHDITSKKSFHYLTHYLIALLTQSTFIFNCLSLQYCSHLLFTKYFHDSSQLNFNRSQINSTFRILSHFNLTDSTLTRNSISITYNTTYKNINFFAALSLNVHLICLFVF